MHFMTNKPPPFPIVKTTFLQAKREWQNQRYQDILRLRDEFKWSYQEIGDLYGVSRQSVSEFMLMMDKKPKVRSSQKK